MSKVYEFWALDTHYNDGFHQILVGLSNGYSSDAICAPFHYIIWC